MPQLCTLGEWLQVQTVGGGPSAGGSMGPGDPGAAAQSASGSRRAAHCTPRPEIRETATSRGLGSKSCFEGVGDLLMSAA